MSFSLAEVLRRVRRTNKSSAGGLSGSTYKTMQAWFYQSDLPRHMELYYSNCGDAVTLAMAPSDPATTLPNRSFATGIIRRPLLPISHVNRVVRRRCPGCHKESTCESSRDEPLRSVDELGTTCWGVRAFPRHVRACGTTLWSRSGSCLPGWLACRAEKMCAT